MDVLNANFEISVDIINKLKKTPEDNELLDVYKYYKQSKFGDNNTEQPSMFNFKNTAKWNAWNSVKGIEKNAAMQHYINLSMELFTKYGS
jgi:diazepam-binding inhibitor (GABA receptor modulator, acyl-CoA-binding protein)